MLHGGLNSLFIGACMKKVNKKGGHTPPAIDGMREEMDIYNDIMHAYQCTVSHGCDRVTTGSRIAAMMARLMKEGGDGCTTTTRNGLLLLLALFLPRGEQVGVPGDDVETISLREREGLFADLAGALPGD